MKKNHSPGGMRIYVRILCYSIGFIAVLGARENLTEGSGPVSRQLGAIVNEALIAGSKLALGVALLTHDEEDENSMSGRASQELGRAAHSTFVSAAKVNLYRY
jgi:hypothetical protein